MSLAETNPELINVDELVLVGPEMSGPKEYVGPDETARLAVIGSFNARIQARKSMLNTLQELPYPAFGNQDQVLADEIVQLRADRDATIITGISNPAIFHRPQLHLVTSPAEITLSDALLPTAPASFESSIPETDQPESHEDKLGRLGELGMAYAALAMDIRASLDSLSGEPTDLLFMVTDRIADVADSTDQVNQATAMLIQRSDELVHAAEHPGIADAPDEENGSEPSTFIEPNPEIPGTSILGTEHTNTSITTPAKPENAPSPKPSLADGELDKKLKAVRRGGGPLGRKPKQRGRGHKF